MNKKLSLILGISLFLLVLPLISAIELNPFAVTKIVEKNVKADMPEFLKTDFNSDYGVIRLSKTIFWIPTDKVAEYSLTSNTERCYLNCEAKGKAVLYTDGALFEDINFKDMKNNLYDMASYQFWLFGGYETKTREVCAKYDENTGVKGEEVLIEPKCLEYTNETYQEEIWDAYNYEPLKAGDYQWKLTGSKKSMEDSVDWLATSNGKVLTEWAYWLEGSAKYVYVGGSNKTVQKFLVDDASLLATSEDYGGTITSITVDDTYVYYGGSTTNKVYRAYKTNLSNNISSASYGGTINSIKVDDTYVYYGGAITRKVYKAYKTNLSNNISSGSYGGTINSIKVDDTYVYYGGATTQKVYKAYKTNLSNDISSADYGGTISSITVDDTYVYYGGYTTNKTYKVYKTNLSNNISSANYGGTINSIAVDDTYVYYGGDTTNKTYKVYKTNLSNNISSASYGGLIRSITVDDTYVYYGGDTTNKVYRAYKTNLSNNISSASYGGTILDLQIELSSVPIITLNSPADTYNSSSASVLFNATATSTIGITNVSLYLDGVLNETNTSGINATSYLFTKSLSDGNHNWSISSCNSAGCETSATRTFTIDTTAPVFNAHNSTDSIYYAVAFGSQFTATDSGVGLEGYSVNDTKFAVNSTGYVTNNSILGAGNYSLRVYANDTLDNQGYFDYVLVVNKAITNLTLSGTSPIEYGTAGNVQGTGCPTQLTCTLTRNTTSVSNPDTTTLGAGTYAYIYDTLGNTNYTSDAEYLTLVVNQNDEVVYTLFNTTSPKTYPYTFKVYSNATSAFKIYRNGTEVTNNSDQTLNSSVYNFTTIRTDNVNYSDIYDEEYFAVYGLLNLTFSKVTPAYVNATMTGESDFTNITNITMSQSNVNLGKIIIQFNKDPSGGVQTFSYTNDYYTNVIESLKVLNDYQLIAVKVVSGGQGIENALVELEQEMGGTYYLIGQGYTDVNGLLYIYGSPDDFHKFTATATGYSSASDERLIPTGFSDTIILNLDPTSEEIGLKIWKSNCVSKLSKSKLCYFKAEMNETKTIFNIVTMLHNGTNITKNCAGLDTCTTNSYNVSNSSKNLLGWLYVDGSYLGETLNITYIDVDSRPIQINWDLSIIKADRDSLNLFYFITLIVGIFIAFSIESKISGAGLWGLVAWFAIIASTGFPLYWFAVLPLALFSIIKLLRQWIDG